MQQPSSDDDGSDGEGEEEVRTLVVRAIDGDWIMGEDVVLPVSGDETIVEVQQARAYRIWVRIRGRIFGSLNTLTVSCQHDGPFSNVKRNVSWNRGGTVHYMELTPNRCDRVHGGTPLTAVYAVTEYPSCLKV